MLKKLNKTIDYFADNIIISTELLWESMNKLGRVTDDQILFNNALEATNVKWTNITNTFTTMTNISLITSWEGHTPSGLNVMLLPQVVACRHSWCQEEVRGMAYIWHHGWTKHKMEAMVGHAKEDGVWFLRREWSDVDKRTRGKVVGVEWLKKISTLL